MNKINILDKLETFDLSQVAQDEINDMLTKFESEVYGNGFCEGFVRGYKHGYKDHDFNISKMEEKEDDKKNNKNNLCMRYVWF